MLSEHVTVETGDTKLSRRFSSAVQVTLRSLEKGEAKKYQNYINEVITVRTGHPLTRGRMTKERLLEFPHVVVEPARTMESVTDGFPDKERNGKRVSVERALYEFQYGRIGPGGRAVVCVPPLPQSLLFSNRATWWRCCRAGLLFGLLPTPLSRCSIRPTGRLP
jgi:hypothetical protein